MSAQVLRADAARVYTARMLERVREQYTRGEVSLYRLLSAFQRHQQAQAMLSDAIDQEVTNPLSN